MAKEICIFTTDRHTWTNELTIHIPVSENVNLANKWSSHSQNQPDRLQRYEEFLLPLSKVAYLFSIYTISGIGQLSQCHFWILVPDSIYSTLKLPLVIALVNASHVVQVLYIITLLHVYSNSLSCYYKMMATMSPLVLGPRLFTTIRTFVSITFKLFKHLRIPSMTGTCLSSLHHKISNTIVISFARASKRCFFHTITLVGASMPIHVVLMQSCCAALSCCTGENF